jgi:2-haloalkanoic acid dehalogenase type II
VTSAISAGAFDPPLRAVLFDFAGTLFSDRALRDVHLQQLRYVAELVGVSRSDAELRAAYRQGMGIAYRAVASRPSYQHRELFGTAFTAMAEMLGGKLDADQEREAVDRQYRATIDGAVLRPDCAGTLRALRQLGLHIQVVSNIDDEQLHGLAERFGLGGLVDALTSSEEAGSCKPDPQIYAYALSKAGCAAAEALFVGDSPAHDIEGPARAGMRTAWLIADAKPRSVDGAGAPRPDLVIDMLGQLIPVLSRSRR